MIRAAGVRASGEEGSVLIVVLAMSGILSLLVGAAFVLARQALQVADDEEEVHGALAAAEAGVEDYLFRLNAREAYWRFGAASDGLPVPPDGNLAFEGFVPVPGGASDAEFTYEVDATRLDEEGVLVLDVTGRAGGRERGVTATLARPSFAEHVYFSDLETLVPQAYATAADAAWAATRCTTRRWEQERPTTGLPSNPAVGCTEVVWSAADVVDGPFHTNDRFRLSGDATWLGPASSSDPSPPAYDANGHTASFAVPGDPRHVPPLELPTSTADLAAAAAAGGCTFTGPTALVLRPDGTVQVTSPRTADSGPGCGTWTAGPDTPQVIALPAGGVVHVQAVPSDPADPNASTGCPTGPGNGLGYPAGDDVGTYDCRAGDAFVEGVLDGRLTISAEHDVVLTWHTEHEGEDDLLGLVAGGDVAVYHPLTCTTTEASGCTAWSTAPAAPTHPTAVLTDPRIDAAILALRGSFLVQSWDGERTPGDPCTPLGTLSVTGSIAQRFRGPVSTLDAGGALCTGYAKAYAHDRRLRLAAPPGFPTPVDAGWQVRRVGERFGP